MRSKPTFFFGAERATFFDEFVNGFSVTQSESLGKGKRIPTIRDDV